MTAAMPVTAQADPPLLYAADVTPGTNVITYEWALWEGARSEFVEGATTPEVNEFGYFRQAGLVNFEVVDPDQQELTDFFRYLPGTYYVHVAGHDKTETEIRVDTGTIEMLRRRAGRLTGKAEVTPLLHAYRALDELLRLLESAVQWVERSWDQTVQQAIDEARGK